MPARFALLAIPALAALAAAQTTVLPNGFAATEGGSASDYPFGRGNSACRVQYIYDSADMLAAGMFGPVSIGTIEWRANAAATTPGGTHGGAGVTLKIGTCAFDHLAVTNTFAANFATSSTFSLNPVLVATGVGTTPNNYTTLLAVPGGYVFDPSLGVDLILEVSFPAGTWTGLATNTTASAMDVATNGGSRVFATTDTALFGSVQSNLPAIIRLGWVPAPGAATHQSYGAGCGASPASCYEWFATTPSIDVANTAITWHKTATGYVVMPGTATFIAPSATATNLNLVDDSETLVTLSAAFPFDGGTTTSLNVCSNGHVSTASNGAAFDYTPTPAELLGWPNTTWALWHDLIPTGPGADNVYFEEVGGIACVTWLAVVGYVGTLVGVVPSTFQFQFELATGDVHLVCLGLDTTSVSTWPGGDGWVLGYSPGGASLDPGSVDLSAVLAGTIVLPAADVLPLALGASPRPLLDTTITYTVSHIDPTALLSVHVLSIGGVDPGIDLTGLGMPGCWQYIDPVFASTYTVVGSPTGTNTFFVPNDLNFVGLPIDNQAASLVPGINPTGAVTSNGLVSTVGIF